MATIRRHPVPPGSYEPDRPLNDLGRDQLRHFIHAAERLPAHLRVDLSIPSPEDGMAASRFIAAVTERLLSTRRQPMKIVSRRKKPAAVPNLALAAAADPTGQPKPQSARKPRPLPKSKSRSPST